MCGGDDLGRYREQTPDPQLDPTRSPGFGVDPLDLEDVDVGRDVTLGTATPEELTAADTEPLDDDDVPAVVERLLDGPVTERRRAALALAERDVTVESTVALCRAARTDDDADVRQFAVEALGKRGGDRAERAALAATDDSDPWVRAEAYVALDRLDRQGYVDRIEAGLDDDHHAVRRNALISLFKSRGRDAEGMLLSFVDDDSDRVREWAAHLLSGVESEAADDALERLQAEDPSEIVRRTASRARDADPGSFRRQFSGALDADVDDTPRNDTLNRQPDL
ncbi:MAG: HEAT repeat domain-containing protein [Haloarculaceae archaeon]